MTLEIGTSRDPKKLKNPSMIIGASHTGKSEIAISYLDIEKETTVIGTADTTENDLRLRIEQLKSKRPNHWKHIESCQQITETIRNEIENRATKQILFDSVNQWVAAFILEKHQLMTPLQIEEALDLELQQLEQLLVQYSSTIRFVFVTSELGAGLSPSNPSARFFRRLVGKSNSKVAAMCSGALLMTASIPSIIKD